MKLFFIILVSVVLIIGAGLFIFAPHPPATPATVKDVAGLESYFQELTESGDPPSVAVAVVQGNDLVYNKAFGWADGPQEMPATMETVYHWWSMTKIATAVSILQLHEAGNLNLDDPVTDYLPYFTVDYPSAEQPAITIRHLLNHTSGLPDTVPAVVGWINQNDAGTDQSTIFQREWQNFNQLKFTPGSDNAYSNFGYMVLGEIIAVVSGQPYEDYVRAHVLQPLQMTQTDFVYTDTMLPDAATGSHPMVHIFTPLLPFFVDMDLLVRERVGNRYWFERIYIDATPPTGLIGPAEDATKLLTALSDDSTFLAAESIELMRPHGEERPLGWAEFGEENGRLWVQHRGGGPGFATIMRLYPEEELGIVILANGTNLAGEALTELVAELMMDS